jgi:cyclopropane fatty-acyl-phospholipid synthase-like methyltransferase
VLDIGRSWDIFAGYATQNLGVSLASIAIYIEQAALAYGLHKVKDIKLQYQDYRDVS